jgi:hypothetical protein
MALLDLTRDVQLGDNHVGVRVDVVLFENQGYTGRLLLWDTDETGRDLAKIFAAPCVLAIDDVLGPATCQGIEVWQLRHEREFRVFRAEALEHIGEAVERLESAAAVTP